jgi:hypothetical protein
MPVGQAQTECYADINQARVTGNLRACMRAKGWEEHQ